MYIPVQTISAHAQARCAKHYFTINQSGFERICALRLDPDNIITVKGQWQNRRVLSNNDARCFPERIGDFCALTLLPRSFSSAHVYLHYRGFDHILLWL